MKKLKTINKRLVGQWEVQADVSHLSVRQISPTGSLWYHVMCDPEDCFNSTWVGTSSDRRTQKELDSINWPTYLSRGDHEIINVLPSGNFYVE